MVERVGRVERVEESSSSRKAVPKANTSTARGLHRERAQRERVVLRMGAGRVAGRILVTSARRDRLATKVVKKDILVSSLLELLEVYVQWERARKISMYCQWCGAKKKKSSSYLGTPWYRKDQ